MTPVPGPIISKGSSPFGSSNVEGSKSIFAKASSFQYIFTKSCYTKLEVNPVNPFSSSSVKLIAILTLEGSFE